MKIFRIILPFLLLTLITNTTFATVSHEGKELKERTHSARKPINKGLRSSLKQTSEIFDSARKLKLTEKYQIKDLVDYLGDNFKRFVGNERGSIKLIGKYKPAPKMPKAYQNLRITKRKTPSSGGGLRKRWKDEKGNVFE